MNAPVRTLFTLTLFCTISLAAHSSPKGGVPTQSSKTDSGESSNVTKGLGNALMTPLSDLNLRRKKIPAQLQVLTSAYDPVGDASCAGLARLVTELDAVLGTDDGVVAAKEATNEKVRKMGLKEISSAVGGLIPLRGIVRQVTGASKHDKRTIVVYQRGLARRGYLKGIGSQKGCKPPAAPAVVQ